jgi:hypothetical protein
MIEQLAASEGRQGLSAARDISADLAVVGI